MPAQEKRKFFSRRAPLFPRATTTYDGIGPLVKHLGERQLPSSFDWRDYNGHSYIGPIRDQGSCGACYAFGACAAAEGAYNWANGKYDGNCADFSEAFVAFCLSDHYSGFDGCTGSDYDYQELTGLVNYGVCNDSVYPYTDHKQACKASSWGAPHTTFQSWHRVGCNDIDAIKTAMMTYGVIDAAVHAEGAFSAYSGGIYQDAKTSCSSNPCYYTETDHIIALVGWNDNGGNGYWILRNSWGTGWGESGYMRVKYTSARVACETAYLVYQSVVSAIYVDPSGSCGGYTPCYSTIQAAIDAASSGSVIKILAGTYAENLNLNSASSYTLQGGQDSTFTSRTSTSSVSSMTFGNNSGAVTVEYIDIQ
jgi:C1A family cysteine protease